MHKVARQCISYKQHLISRSELLNIFAVNVCSKSCSFFGKCYKVKAKFKESLRTPWIHIGNRIPLV